MSAAGLSVVCVFNDAEVRQACLDRSLRMSTETVEFIPVDNTEHAFRSAGAALNHGARQASHDVVVFVHQDAYLHSVPRLIDASRDLASGRWGMLGAAGVTHDGQLAGRIRDRVELIGGDAPEPVEVDSLDEVLFMVSREQVLEHPLSEDHELSWHAYAVEYGLRLRRQGLRTGALNLGVTHNSLTTNLARLDEAHRHLATTYPELAPVYTTCGVVSKVSLSRTRLPVLDSQRWRYRWWKESRLARQAQRRLPAPAVLHDIRVSVDLLDLPAGTPLHVVNLDSSGGFTPYASDPLHLTRRGRPLVAQSCADLDGLRALMAEVPPAGSALLTNLTLDELAQVARAGFIDPDRALLGVHEDSVWLLVGAAVANPPGAWQTSRATPLALAATRR